MFLGVGAVSAFGGIFHLFTHAFFKALLFLTAGSVMHAMVGQLDLRKMSGLIRKMPITGWLMFVGCLALAGVPLTAGFYSKDEILYSAINSTHRGVSLMGWVGVLTALLTAFYTFRLWFRVFLGPEKFEMGDEHHGYSPTEHPWEFEGQKEGNQHDGHAHGHHGPHEATWLMNGPLMVLAVGALVLGVVCTFGEHPWMETMIGGSTAASHDAHAHLHKGDAGYISHLMVGVISGGGALVMIGLAAYFHLINRGATDKIAEALKPVVILLNRKWYIDEMYHAIIVTPLRLLGYTFYLLFDRFILDGLIYDGLLQWTPKAAGEAQGQTMQRGRLQGFAVAMGLGLVIVLAIIAYAALV
jgi:NADH-quinone oxidoreductase subunit L